MPTTLQDRWLSLGKACEILGVNETTLRHWANIGRLRTYRTPGGHRRFSRDEINALLQRAGAAPSPEALPQAALERIRRRIHRRRGQPDGWLRRFDEEGRTRMRVLGRRLVSLATDYFGQKRRRSELDEEARHLGLDYGRELATRGVPLSEAISAFIFFRDSLHEAIRQGPGASAASPEPWQDVRVLEDRVLLGLAESYERLANRSPAQLSLGA